MNSCSRLKTYLAVVVIGALFGLGCQEYDGPPDVRLAQPEGGAFSEGDPLILRFSEPIDTDTLTVQIWPNARGTRRTPLVSDVKPLIESCKLTNTPCQEELLLEIAEDRLSASVTIEGERGRPGQPMIVEVAKGLSDTLGNKTGVSHYFAFQFRAGAGDNEGDVEFDNGTYILGATINNPVPAVLTLVSDIVVLPNGRMALAGADGDAIGDAPRTTLNPREIIMDSTSEGWAAFVVGRVSLNAEGQRFLETEPFDVNLPLAGMQIELTNMRLFAEITKNPTTGKDRLDGTISFEHLILTMANGRQSSFDGDSAGLIADFVDPALAPVGHPLVCGDLCGVVVGTCNPPEDFPPDNFCDDVEYVDPGPRAPVLVIEESALPDDDEECPAGGRLIRVGVADHTGGIDPNGPIQSFVVCDGSTGNHSPCFERPALALEDITLEELATFEVGTPYTVTLSTNALPEDTDLTFSFAGLGAEFGEVVAATDEDHQYEVEVTPTMTGGPFHFIAMASDGCTVATQSFAMGNVE